MTRLLLLIEMLACTAFSAPVAIAVRASPAVKVDGDVTDWNPGQFGRSPELFFGEGTTFTEAGTVKSNADHSARFFFAFRGDELLVAALVRDDAVVTVRGEDQWKGDGLELLFPRADGSLLHVGVNPVGDVHRFGKPGPPSDQRITAATSAESTGWSVEVSIPLASLAVTEKTASISFNLAMRDVDPGEPTPAHRVWSGQRHTALASAGTLQFDRASLDKPWPACAAFSSEVKLTAPLQASGRALRAGTTPVRLRLVNFQSASKNWQTFWADFNRVQVLADLDAAKRLKANAIRLFVFDAIFGLDPVHPEYLERLRFVVREAAKRGLLSVVSFFPFKKEVRPSWDEAMQHHLEQVVSAFRGDPAIAMWDLMNEPDHLWAQLDAGTSADVNRWAQRMYDAVRAADSTHLVTVGLYGHFTAHTPANAIESLPFVDVLSAHWYGEVAPPPTWFSNVANVADKPVILQEFGASSLNLSPREATAYLDSVCAAAALAQVAGIGMWELFDHPVGSIAHQQNRWLETAENDYGLLDFEGRPKPQAVAFCRCLQVPGFVVQVKGP